MVLQERNLVGDDMGIWHATNVTFFHSRTRGVMLARMRSEESHSVQVAKRGHWWPPPSMVISTTLRLSAHPAVDVVTGPLVVAAGSPH